MRRFAILALALGICGAPACDDDSPNNPSGQPIVFTAQLTTGAEVPALGNTSEAGGSGSVTITMVVPTDSSGNPTAGGTANFQYSLTGFPNGTTIRAAHIHIGAAGVSGGIRVDTGLTPATAVVLTNGSGVINATNAVVNQADAQGIVSNPSGWYFNAHSNLNPSGVVRGQLVRVQ